MKNTVATLSTIELIKLYKTNSEVFYLKYISDKKARENIYIFRKTILQELFRRLEEEYKT